MGECLILRRGGNLFELPVLNQTYPKDVTVVAAASGNATFKVQIDEDGRPDKYTYQWYVNGSAVSGATSSTYSKSISIAAGTYTVYCIVTNKAGEVYSRYATLTIKDPMPIYTYNGTHTLVKENDNGEKDDSGYNWSIYLKSKGRLNFSYLGAGESGVDVFLVGGGGGGGTNDGNGGGAQGGGGGRVKTVSGKTLSLGTDNSISIGGGGSSDNKGGSTSAFDTSVSGGSAGLPNSAGGGSGGSGGGGAGKNSKRGGKGGSNGNSGTASAYAGGSGLDKSTGTYEFGDSTRTLYSGGGGGCNRYGDGYGSIAGGGGGGGAGSATPGNAYAKAGSNGKSNTGGGGGGGNGDASGDYDTAGHYGGKGGSGIVVIRNHR